jgi:hypothetical protein
MLRSSGVAAGLAASQEWPSSMKLVNYMMTTLSKESMHCIYIASFRCKRQSIFKGNFLTERLSVTGKYGAHPFHPPVILFIFFSDLFHFVHSR